MSIRPLYRFLTVASINLLPVAASAAATFPTDFGTLANGLVNVLDGATIVAIGLGVLFYIKSIATSIGDAGSAKGWQNLRDRAGWGLVALFVMFSIWGILRLLSSAIYGNTNFQL